MEEGEEISGPWRATRLWNNIIRNFRSGMPLKKHKKNLRTYESCFSSTEAVDWLHKNLQKNPNFGAGVSKEQTTQLLGKLYRAGIIENVREDANDDEFKISGELYRFSTKSPVRVLRTPGKQERRPLVDAANTPRSSRPENKENIEGVQRRDRSGNRKVKEEMKKQLNLSYFQALPSNSLIILDNDDIWRRVYMEQLTLALSSSHTERLDYAGQLDMENIMHNMTKVSAKGIVQAEDKYEDLPHWVLSAMKCLANWPKQLKTVNGKESCLPNYSGFEHDVFNVVKDYFNALPGPLTTFPLYEFLIDGYNMAEFGNNKQSVGVQRRTSTRTNCRVHRGSLTRPCTRPYTQTNVDNRSDFYTMTDQVEDFSLLSNQERVAKIRQTFQVLPPLATSSLQTSNNSTNSGHTTFDTTSPSLSPEMSTTAIMKQFLPPNTCFETAFVEESPITRIVPQKEHEVLHFKRSWSGRSLSHISTDWATKSTSTQTDSQEQNSGSSLKRVPKWKRTSRFRKSIAVMESQDRRRVNSVSGTGIDNGGFLDTPSTEVNLHPGGRPRQLKSTGSLPDPMRNPSIRGCSSVDNLLDRESKFEEEFMMKYRQVTGDLRASCDLVERSQREISLDNRDRSFIQSKTVRKEKKKRWRNASTDRLGYETDTDIRYDPAPPYEESTRHCYVNRGLEQSPNPNISMAPLAAQEISNLSPVPFNRHSKYNFSYRLATNQPATPAGQKLAFPRTSTQIRLEHSNNNNNIPGSKVQGEYKDCVNVRAEPYLYSEVNSVIAPNRESLYTSVGQGPLQRYPPPTRPPGIPPPLRTDAFRRDTAARASRCSEATVDSGRYSDYSRASTARMHHPGVEGHYSKYSKTVPHRVLAERLEGVVGQEEVETRAIQIFKLITLLIPPANRRKLQLLLKFIRKVSLNFDLGLDSGLSNRELSVNTFTDVILRPGDVYAVNLAVNRKIINLFIDKYEEIWSPPESLRKEVEEKVYHSLVDRRIKAGEDPYPVSYCKQVTTAEYEAAKMTGAETALLDLLNAILVDRKMPDKDKIKKMKKFKDAYPHIWRRKFPSVSSEPELGRKTGSKFGSLSRIKSVMGM